MQQLPTMDVSDKPNASGTGPSHSVDIEMVSQPAHSNGDNGARTSDMNTQTRWSVPATQTISIDGNGKPKTTFGGVEIMVSRSQEWVESDEEEDDGYVTGLDRTHKFLGGVRADFWRRVPHYISDWKDGLHPQIISTSFLIFFAVLAPAISFGGLYNKDTKGAIGVSEVIVASSITGCVYSVFGGSPIIILGGTGPVYYFTKVMFELCESNDIAFLPARFWIGMWTALFCIILASTEASSLVKYCTRFTDETFSCLIALIFIWEAGSSVLDKFTESDSCDPTVESCCDKTCAVTTLCLSVATVSIALSLRAIRSSDYFRVHIRAFLADYGTVIAIIFVSGIRHIGYLEDVHIDMLHVNTDKERSWVVDATNVPTWLPFAAILPAILATILVYLDQNITCRVINARDNKLAKGPAYHWDLMVVGVMIGVCSIFGFPWLIAATVRSLAHLRSLEIIEVVDNKDGSRHNHVVGVREQRVSATVVHILLGLSVFLVDVLEQVPMAVLYGVFLFMGLGALAHNQFWERIKMFFVDPRHYPSEEYVRVVPIKIIHKYTLLQLGCFAVLWIVKLTPAIAISFPFFLLILIPIRQYFNRVFEKSYLSALDADERPVLDDEADLDLADCVCQCPHLHDEHGELMPLSHGFHSLHRKNSSASLHSTDRSNDESHRDGDEEEERDDSPAHILDLEAVNFNDELDKEIPSGGGGSGGGGHGATHHHSPVSPSPLGTHEHTSGGHQRKPTVDARASAPKH